MYVAPAYRLVRERSVILLPGRATAATKTGANGATPRSGGRKEGEQTPQLFTHRQGFAPGA